MSRLICPLLILLLHLGLHPAGETGSNESKAAASDRRALEKALLFPGWGHFHEKQYVKGVVFSMAEAAAITSAFINNRKGNQSYNNYKRAVTPEDAVFWRNETEKYDRRRNLFMAAGAAVWILNLADIYFSGKRKRDKGLSLVLIPGTKHEVSFLFTYHF